MSIIDVINNSETANALHLGDEIVRSTCIQEINQNNALKIDGETLYQRGTILLKPSAHAFLSNQYNEYRISRKGTKIKWPKKGTQPYSTQGHALKAFSGTSTDTYVYLYREDGVLYSEVNSMKSSLGDRYFLILHGYGAGGGGKNAFTWITGKGGGSGAIGAWLVNMTYFTPSSKLEIKCPPGTAAGDDGGDLEITSSANGANGKLTVYGGRDEDGGQTPSYTDNIRNCFYSLAESKGADASSIEGALVPTIKYTEPNPSQIESKAGSYGFGSGGRGGEPWAKGERGYRGGILIYY